MADIIIKTRVTLSGDKEAITRVLNRALNGLRPEVAAVECADGVEAINQKIQTANGVMTGFGAEFTLMDFLDDRNRMDSPCREYVLSYIDEEEPDGSDDYGVRLIEVRDDKTSFSLIIESEVLESQGSYTGGDWHDWCRRMVRLYGVTVGLEQTFGSYSPLASLSTL